MEFEVAYCTGCGYLPTAVSLTEKVAAQYQERSGRLVMIPRPGGVSEVRVNGREIHAEQATGQFPEEGPIVAVLGDLPPRRAQGSGGAGGAHPRRPPSNFAPIRLRLGGQTMTAFTDRQRAFLDGAHHAIVATLRRDGTPSQSIVWYVRDGDTLWISVRPDSVKAKHIARDPRVSVLVASVDSAARRRLIGRYVGADQADAWLAGHPLPTPNARLRIHPTHVAAYNIDP